jgi:hypothetical protein
LESLQSAELPLLRELPLKAEATAEATAEVTLKREPQR